MEAKKHFKLYKSGKQWMSMAIAIASTAIGISFALNVQADTQGVEPVATETTQMNDYSVN